MFDKISAAPRTITNRLIRFQNYPNVASVWQLAAILCSNRAKYQNKIRTELMVPMRDNVHPTAVAVGDFSRKVEQQNAIDESKSFMACDHSS